jgi:carboxyl-terminal processing protease
MDQPSKETYSGRHILHAVLQGLVAGLLLGAAFAAGFLYRDVVSRPAPSQTSFDLLKEIDGLLASHYLYDMPDETTRIHGAAAGLVASLGNPYTYFQEPQASEVDTTNLAGRFGGIGAEIGRDEQGRYVIQRVYRDNPAYNAGIIEGDVILAVDGTPVDTSATDPNQLLAAIRGEVGTSVTLTLQRGDEIFDVTVVRAEILIPSVFWNLAEAEPRIGYIRITSFTERTPEEFDQALSELSAQGAQAYILDLRDNGGGLVDAAVAVVSEFVNGGVVLYEQRRDSGERVLNATQGGRALDIPLAVLINGQTASASEIVAGAFQDRGRATLIGQQSFGKGSVQVILTLSDGSSIHVTTAEWYTPNHHRLEGQGLTPDIVVEPAEGTDTQLDAALEFLSERLTVVEVEH